MIRWECATPKRVVVVVVVVVVVIVKPGSVSGTVKASVLVGASIVVGTNVVRDDGRGIAPFSWSNTKELHIYIFNNNLKKCMRLLSLDFTLDFNIDFS